MGKKKKIIDKEVKDLTDGLDKGLYSPGDVLAEVLEEFYDAKKTLKKDQSQEAHAKVWEILEAVRQRNDAESTRAYLKYYRVYQGLCMELRLDEKPAYIWLEQTAENNGEVLTREFSSLISAIQGGNLRPEYFLRQGLDELADMASEIPTPRMRFARAKQTYVNVMNFLGTSGFYDGVETFRQKYNSFLAKVNGKFSTSGKYKSSGIGRIALSPLREPRRDFRKGLGK